jgi:hypothetical protein
MRIHWRTALAAVVASALAILLLRALWPVGWFDLLVTLGVWFVFFLIIRFFKGFTTDTKSE